MQEELDALLQLLPPANHEELRGTTGLWRVCFGDRDLLLTRSGVGKVNTATSLTLLLSAFPVDKVINLGTAGGLRRGQKILDLVIPDEAIAVDVDVTPLGFEYGQILGEPASYRPSPEMRQHFLQAATAWPSHPTIHEGAVGSSDAFICRPEQVEQIRTRFGTDRVACVEMEGAAIAQVCHRFGIPFLIVRSLSDVPASDKDNQLDFQAFLEKAAHNAARLVVEMLRFPERQ